MECSRALSFGRYFVRSSSNYSTAPDPEMNWQYSDHLWIHTARYSSADYPQVHKVRFAGLSRISPD
jgi:hypothetical protein